MKHITLFGHVAHRFTSHPENLATEALGYVLNQCPAAASAFVRHLSQFGMPLPSITSFRTQVGDSEGAIPDVIGFDSDGRRSILIEAKFWAGLTDSQPVGYLASLPEKVNGVLIFVAPTRRLDTLWVELKHRCQSANLKYEELSNVDAGSRAAQVNSHHIIALTSWQSVLSILLNAADTSGDIGVAADIRQLQGLCSRMDDEAFLPLRSEELSPLIGLRVLQFCRIVDSVTTKLVSQKLASIEGTRASGSGSYYARYMRIHGNGCSLMFSAEYWSRKRETPLWLSVKGPNWELTKDVQEALSSLENKNPPALIRADNDLLIPLAMKLGVEQDQVVNSLVEQVREVEVLLRSISTKTQTG